MEPVYHASSANPPSCPQCGVWKEVIWRAGGWTCAGAMHFLHPARLAAVVNVAL
jgi:hypothetical protein